MKRLVFALLMLAAGFASADDLGNAKKALRAKEYDKAFPIYTKLANAGNAESAVPPGRDVLVWRRHRGRHGQVPGLAAESRRQRPQRRRETLAVLQKREQRAADIAYWTSGYKGEDLPPVKFACPMPAIPQVSKTNAEIKAISEAIATGRPATTISLPGSTSCRRPTNAFRPTSLS